VILACRAGTVRSEPERRELARNAKAALTRMIEITKAA
jgi:hypothetical protein